MINDFSQAADLYDRIFAARHKDYTKESATIESLVGERNAGAKTLLDVACGTGKHLALLARRFDCEGIDADPKMLAIARARLPGTQFAECDMRDFSLGRRFDVIICMFGSITYVGSPAELDRTAAAMRRHLAPGGVILVEPFVGPDEYQTGHASLVTVDDPDLKFARMHVSARRGDTAILDHHIMVAKSDGVDHFVERHELALFTEDDYARAFAKAGLRSRLARPDAIRAGVHVAWEE